MSTGSHTVLFFVQQKRITEITLTRTWREKREEDLLLLFLTTAKPRVGVTDYLGRGDWEKGNQTISQCH